MDSKSKQDDGPGGAKPPGSVDTCPHPAGVRKRGLRPTTQVAKRRDGRLYTAAAKGR
jgi:hypothetical protein